MEALRQATRRALKNLVRLAIDSRVDFVLITGDLYDGDWKDYNTGLYFVSQMKELREANIPAYIIAGNHDAANKMTKTLKLPDGIHLFPMDKPGTLRLDDLDVAIHGQGFATPAVKEDLSAGYPPAVSGCFNIGMLHTCATGQAGHEPYAPCTITALRSKGYDYWALGHIHQREVLHKDPLIVFPGNIQGRHIRETGPKGCILAAVDNSGRATIDFHPLDVIRWERCTVDASGAEAGYDVVELISGRLEELSRGGDGLPRAVRIEITGSCQAHAELAADLERWTNEIRSVALDSSAGQVWIEKIKVHTTLPATNNLAELADGPIGELFCVLEESRHNPDRLRALGGSLSDLRKSLPRELKDGSDAIDLDDPKWLAGVLDQIQPMLLRRLMSKGEAG